METEKSGIINHLSQSNKNMTDWYNFHTGKENAWHELCRTANKPNEERKLNFKFSVTDKNYGLFQFKMPKLWKQWACRQYQSDSGTDDIFEFNNAIQCPFKFTFF